MIYPNRHKLRTLALMGLIAAGMYGHMADDTRRSITARRGPTPAALKHSPHNRAQVHRKNARRQPKTIWYRKRVKVALAA